MNPIEDPKSSVKNFLILFTCAFALLAGCEEPPSKAQRDAANPKPAEDSKEPAAKIRLVIYTSVDTQYAAQILNPWAAKNGVSPLVIIGDTEASKSVGLAERLRSEKANPQADVWWGNEPFHTINLADEDLFEPYTPAFASEVPDRYKDPKARWTGVGLRARVLAVSALHPVPANLDNLEGLKTPDLKGKIAMAKPRFSTTGGHIAALYVAWGPYRFRDFFSALRENDIKILGGNSDVAEAVGRGTILVGITDNDDIAAATAAGLKLNLFLPDQKGMGTLTMPTTVALVKGAHEPDKARQLIDYLCSAEVERQLIDMQYAGWSTREGPRDIKAMDVDYAVVARKMPEALKLAQTVLEGREVK